MRGSRRTAKSDRSKAALASAAAKGVAGGVGGLKRVHEGQRTTEKSGHPVAHENLVAVKAGTILGFRAENA